MTARRIFDLGFLKIDQTGVGITGVWTNVCSYRNVVGIRIFLSRKLHRVYPIFLYQIEVGLIL